MQYSINNYSHHGVHYIPELIYFITENVYLFTPFIYSAHPPPHVSGSCQSVKRGFILNLSRLVPLRVSASSGPPCGAPPTVFLVRLELLGPDIG